MRQSPIMVFARSRRVLAACAVLTASFLSRGSGFAQGVATIIQTVKPADPGLTWQTPAAIAYATPLSSVQLNASAAVPGKFTYQPAAGTILPPGPNTLSVAFQPDGPNYLARTLTVVLSVTPSPLPGFSFALTLDSAAHGPFVLSSGKSPPIHLTVARLLDFDQTVTFSCRNPPPGEVCVFTPASGRLLEKPLAVSLVFQRASASSKGEGYPDGRSRGGGGLRGGAELVSSGVFAAAIVMTGIRRRRPAMAAACRTVAFGFPVVALMLGCGIGRAPDTIQQVSIVATTPYESHSVTISVVVERGSGGRDPIGRDPIGRR